MTVRLLHQIGDRQLGTNFNTLEEILHCDEPMHFDGVYQSVWQNYERLIGRGKDITFFVSGAYLGKMNAFDIHQPLSKFCTIRQVERMASDLKARIGWHGKRHKRCYNQSLIDVQEELSVPDWWTHIDRAEMILAWPYGDFNGEAVEVAKRLGFKEAWSVTQGDDSEFARKRAHLNW